MPGPRIRLAVAAGPGARADDGLVVCLAIRAAGLPAGLTGDLRIRRQPERPAERVGELAAGGIAIGGCLGQGPGEHLIRGRRQVWPLGRQRRRRLRDLRVHDGHGLVTLERRCAGQQLERRARQRILIRAPVHLMALELLGRNIVQRAQELPGAGQPGGRQHRLAQPEVRQVHVIGPPGPRVHQHVRRLDIAVHQPGRVRGVQRRRHRRDDRSRPPRGQRALTPHQGAHIAARHIPHRDEQHPARLAGLEHRDDMRVIHRRSRPRLPQEPLPELRIGRQRRRQNLQRHQPAQPLIARPEHHRHPALADLLLQQIPRHPRARAKPGQQAARLLRHLTAHDASPASRPILAPRPGSARARNAATWRPEWQPPGRSQRPA